jgi:oxygen-dependent protoporphyrinogen oxidase
MAMRAEMAAKTGASRPTNGSKCSGSRSVFLTPTTGLAEIVEALVECLHRGGVELRLRTGVRSLAPAARGEGYLLHLENGETLAANHAILAAPAYAAAEILAGMDPTLAAELAQIEYVTTATVSLAYRQADLPRPLDGYGYVIPRREGREALACTWTSTKFPHRAPSGFALLRVFIGRAGQEDDIPWDESGLLAMAQAEVEHTLGIRAKPTLWRVFHWEKAMPQYNLGHIGRLQRVKESLRRWPGLAMAGNGYGGDGRGGIGIPDCIHSGQLAAEQCLAAAFSSQPT